MYSKDIAEVLMLTLIDLKDFEISEVSVDSRSVNRPDRKSVV